MKKLIVITLVILYTSVSFSQGSAGTNAKFEYRSLIDLPSAGVLEKGYVGVALDVLPAGTVIPKIEVGVFDNFSFGISYGGSNIIGTGSISWYELPGVNLKFRIVDETAGYPAVTLGFDSQGKGIFNKEVNRFDIKSPGFFAAVAKNFELLGYFSIHGVVNYSLERDDNDKDLNLGIGVEKTIGGKISLVAEYDFAINDNNKVSFGDGNGYLNMGVRWTVGDGFTLGVDLRDLLSNKKFNSNRADRGIFVEYVKAIF
ncbi:MAG: YjbH domain-containing protein [Bacteroidetes bacterium]|nr:YjbH domain-containing protein [Bacteroidota bacterium]